MRFLAVLVVIALTVYAVIDCARAQQWERRGLPAWLWILVIIVLPVIGPVTWLISRWSTPNPGSGGGPSGRRGPVAPDDDPDFLAGLDRHTPRTGRGGTQHPESENGNDTPSDSSGTSGPSSTSGPSGSDTKHTGASGSEDDGGEDPHHGGQGRRRGPGASA